MKRKLCNGIILILLLILVFSDYLSNIVSPILGYTDEFILVIMTALFILKIVLNKEQKIKLKKQDVNIIIAYIFIFLFGIIGNLMSGYQTSVFAIIIDAISILKFFWVYICMKNLITEKNEVDILNGAIFISKIIICISIVLEIANIATGFLGGYKYGEFGLPAFNYGGHPYFASAVLACVISILLTDYKKNKMFIMLGIILEILTFRAKAYLFIALITFFALFSKRKISIGKILTVSVILLIIGWDKLAFYFLDTGSSRATLLLKSIEIAKNYFPLGSGFATFGTIMSGAYYSKAYEIFNLSHRYGFSKNAYSFITDGGWAGIIGQLRSTRNNRSYKHVV